MRVAIALSATGGPWGDFVMVRQRMRAWRDAGITTLRVYPAGQTLEERLTTLGRAIDIVEDLNREQA
jgi:hypothetical protein